MVAPPICLICQDPDVKEEVVRFPCPCRGASAVYVHPSCQSLCQNSNYCIVCKRRAPNSWYLENIPNQSKKCRGRVSWLDAIDQHGKEWLIVGASVFTSIYLLVVFTRSPTEYDSTLFILAVFMNSMSFAGCLLLGAKCYDWMVETNKLALDLVI